MNRLAILAFVVLLGAGVAIGVMMYRQLGTVNLTLTGTPQLVVNSAGAECGEVAFEVQARSIGEWHYNVPKGKTITGTVTVGGDETKDIGVTIWSPTNRIVVFIPDRGHQVEFEVVGTIRGEYRFDFDNRHSAFTEKKLTVSLCLV